MDEKIFFSCFLFLCIGGFFPAESVSSWAWRRSFTNYRKEKCEPVTIDLCKGLHYNQTRFPNFFDHRNQHEAALEVGQFSPLVKVKCSIDLKLFLCTLYVPVCATNYSQPLKPCRSLCKRARRGCVRLMKQFGFKWPPNFRCKKFPRRKRDPMCVDRTLKSDGKKDLKKKNRKHGKKAGKKGGKKRGKKEKSGRKNNGNKKDSRRPAHL